MLMKGQKYQMINLGLNQFSSADVDGFDSFLVNQPDTFQLVLAGNNFDLKAIEKLRNAHPNKVIF